MTAMEPDIASENGAAASGEFESQIRELLRRDVAPLRKCPSEGTADSPMKDASQLLQRVAGASMAEIEKVIQELQNVRDTMRKEGERVQREIGAYGHLSQAAMASMKAIGQSMVQWRTPLSQRSNGPGSEAPTMDRQ